MPDSLFHFCAVNTDDRKNWLQNILIDSQVYFRSREQLNDPNELRPRIIFSGTDKKIREYVRQMVLTRWSHKLSPAKRLQEENRLIYLYRNAPDGIEVTLHELLDRVGIFCLTKSSDHPLLWAHYADGSRGICIEFDANVGLFLAAQKVHYTDQIPVINRLVDDREEILKKSMFTKGADWFYEQEWRIIARWDDQDRKERYIAQHDVPESMLSFIQSQHGPGYYRFPIEAIRSVILGSRIEPNVEIWLRGVLASADHPIEIKRHVSTRSGVK